MAELRTGTVTFLLTDSQAKQARATSQTMWLGEGRATNLMDIG